ncbi:hypothetical protein [Nocardia sp. NPDC049149]|uniref:hypothetical protein n=1 Tax=Nocardia sp. NPDC049149 TaxID=3364315 RepID=UPI0037201060
MSGDYVFVTNKGLYETRGGELETVVLLGEHRDEVHARWSPKSPIDSWRGGDGPEPTGPWSDRLNRSGEGEEVRVDYDAADRVAFIEVHEPETAIAVDDEWLYLMRRHHTEALAELGENGFGDPEKGSEGFTFHDRGLGLWVPWIDDDEDDPLDEDDENYGVRAIAIFAPGYYESSREPAKS